MFFLSFAENVFVLRYFDIRTIAVFFAAPPELFRTAWFIESMATQILVIFFYPFHRFLQRAASGHSGVDVDSGAGCRLGDEPVARRVHFRFHYSAACSPFGDCRNRHRLFANRRPDEKIC